MFCNVKQIDCPVIYQLPLQHVFFEAAAQEMCKQSSEDLAT